MGSNVIVLRGVAYMLALIVWAGGESGFGAPSQGRGSPVPAPSGNGELRGRVLELEGGRPIAGVRLTLVAYAPATATGRGTAYAAVHAASDATGGFEFEGLSAGDYALTAYAPGYASGSYLAARPESQVELFRLGAGEKKNGIEIRLSKYGSISGLVRDSGGAPAANVRITLFQSRFVAGRSQLTARRETATTDDRGTFRIENLSPGVYIAAVVVTEASRLQRVPPNSVGVRAASLGNWVRDAGRFAVAGQDGTSRSHQTMFFPDVLVASNAARIELAAGESRSGVDFRMRVTESYSVSGTLTSQFGPVSGVELRLMARDSVAFTSDAGVEVATTETDQDGRFVFLSVPSGDYLLKGMMVPRAGERAEALWTESLLSVASADVRDLSQKMQPGGKISGRVRFVGTRLPPASAELGRISIVPLPVDTTLITRMALPRATSEGTFVTPGLPDGRYFLDINSGVPAWGVQSITAGGVNLLSEPLTIVNGQDLLDVVITFADRRSSIAGFVTSGTGTPDATADVVLIPSDAETWRKGLFPPKRARRILTSRTGAFSFDDIPEGSYWLVAVRGLTSEGWQNPVLLQGLLGGATRVAVRSGDRTSIALKAVSAPQGK